MIGLWKKPKLKVVVLTSGTSWTVPDNVRVLQTVECWGGGGGSSAASSSSFGGGGGGAYIRYDNLSVTPGSSIPIQIGGPGIGRYNTGIATAGGDTWFKANNIAMAKGGSPSLVDTSYFLGGAGGQASASYGSVKMSGGTGGSAYYGSGGGGGGAAGSPAGDGANGAGSYNSGGYGYGGAGGSAYGTTNGGAAGSLGGGNIALAQQGDQLGGGGGGGGNQATGPTKGADGGFPGGGAGANGYNGTGVANGAQGQIIIKYLVG